MKSTHVVLDLQFSIVTFELLMLVMFSTVYIYQGLVHIVTTVLTFVLICMIIIISGKFIHFNSNTPLLGLLH